MKIKREKTIKVVSELYQNIMNFNDKFRFYVEVTVKRKFLWFYITKKYKVHNIKCMKNFGMKEEFLVDFVIYFPSEEIATNFVNDNLDNINDQGIYTGGISTMGLNIKYGLIEKFEKENNTPNMPHYSEWLLGKQH